MAIPEGKVFDLEKMELVDAPVKEETPAPAVEKKEEEPAKEEVEEVKAEATDEVKKEEAAEEEPAKEEKPVEKKEEEKSVEQIGVDDFVKEKYADFGIETEEALDERLAELIAISEQYESTKKELADLKAYSGKPQFASPQEEKAFEYLKEFDISNMGEGLQTIARIVTMDIDKADPRILLEEKYIFDHPEFTRDEALRKFSRDYTKKHSIKEEDFETPELYKEEVEDLRLSEKSAAAKAKEFLEKKQKELKTKPKETAVETKESPVVHASIKKVVKEVDEYIADFQSITYAPTENEKDNFTIKLSKDQQKLVNESMKAWVSNPANYDSKGELIGGLNPEKQSIQVAYMLFGDDIFAKMYAHVMNQADIKRAEQIATKKPDREAKTVVEKVTGVSEEKQQEQMIRRKQAERSKSVNVY